MPDIADAIQHYSYPTYYLKLLIDAVEAKDLWLKPRPDDIDPNNYRCQQVKVTALPELKRFDDHFLTVFGDVLDHYNKLWNTPANCDTGYTLLKYRTGDECTLHCDLAAHETRVCTAIFYANDDYEGGELVFPRQSIKIRPRAGDVIVMPATEDFPHKVEPVTKGNRYCVRCFFVFRP